MTPPVLSVFYISLFTLCIGNQRTACRCSPIIIKNSFQVQQRDVLRQTSVYWPQGSWNATQSQQQPQNKSEPFSMGNVSD